MVPLREVRPDSLVDEFDEIDELDGPGQIVRLYEINGVDEPDELDECSCGRGRHFGHVGGYVSSKECAAISVYYSIVKEYGW